MTVDEDARRDTPAAQGGRASSTEAKTRGPGRRWPVLGLVVALFIGGAAGWLMHGRIGVGSRVDALAPVAAVDRSDPRSQFEIEREAAILARLNRHPWDVPPCVKDVEPCSLWHTLLAQQRIERNGQRFDVFVYGSGFRDGEGHSTKAPISMVETDEKGRVIHANVEFTDGGIYGQPNMNGERYTVIPLDGHVYAIAIEESDMHFGLVDETLSLHVFVDGKPRGGFSGPIGAQYDETGSPYSAWKGGWTLIQVPKGGPELLITKRGIQEGRLLDTVERYRWDGKAFAPFALPAADAVPAVSASDAAGNGVSSSAASDPAPDRAH